MDNPINISYIQEKTIPALKRAGVLKSAIFGSFARGEAGPESDVDLLVEFPEDKTMLDLIELQDNLESALGKKVDIVTYRSIHHLLRDRILLEQIPIL
ncbi:MAG: nucleotidyltransferase family protein [Candidatus Yanofskybacteria bacterium]|nr:nucleotidyltransferase family protein [Candidatus Yanofskybacteria bacterium]